MSRNFNCKKVNDGCPHRSDLFKNYISYFSIVLVLYVYNPVRSAPIVRRKIHSTRQDKDSYCYGSQLLLRESSLGYPLQTQPCLTTLTYPTVSTKCIRYHSPLATRMSRAIPLEIEWTFYTLILTWTVDATDPPQTRFKVRRVYPPFSFHYAEISSVFKLGRR